MLACVVIILIIVIIYMYLAIKRMLHFIMGNKPPGYTMVRVAPAEEVVNSVTTRSGSISNGIYKGERWGASTAREIECLEIQPVQSDE